MTSIADLPEHFKEDVFTLLCGQLIGSGVSRNVYTCRLNDEWVVKVEYAAQWFQNVREDAVWDSVRFVDGLSEWFAPIIAISDNGKFMVQRLCKPVRLHEMPERIPRFFTDTKLGNWGWLDGRVVCHDYGTVLTTEYGLSKRLKKADWWE